jgi:hypothetical protein
VTRLGDEIGDLALDLAWSLWSELGVDGTIRRHDWQAIDLEPLLIFTAWIGSADRRLRSRTIEWSIANHRLASAIRMRNLGRRASPSTRESFGRYAATVRAETNAPWPAAGDPLALVPSASIDEPDLRRPSLLQLRLRALVGVSARAEVLRVLLSDHDRPKPAAALAEAAAYSKGSVTQALELLTLAGIVQMQPSGNRLVYRLARPADLRQTLQSLPSGFPDWPPIFRITESLAAYARSAPSSSSARLNKLRSVLHTLDDDVRRLGIADVIPRVNGPASVPEIERWAVTFVADQAGMTQVSSAERDVTYTVQHLALGGWIGTIHDRGREPRRLGASAEQEEASGPTTLALAMFRDVLGRESQKLMGSASSNGGVPATGREFADQIVGEIERGQEASFTAEFLRRWFENRRGRVEGWENTQVT